MKRLLLTLIIALGITATLSAECEYVNKAFSSGKEHIAYNLYFNWQFVWVKAGTATMYTVPTVYKGQKAYRTSLVTKSSDKVDKFFMMRDTLLVYFSKKLTPLYYRKGAREGDRYYVDEMWYSYPKEGECLTTLKHLHANGRRSSEKHLYQSCVTDMLNAFQQVRNFDASQWQKGHTEYLDLAGADEMIRAKLVYQGKETVKADNGKKYSSLVISYVEKEDGKDKEIVRFYVTDDERHIPVRLDLFLRFGTAKAFLSTMK